MFFWGTQCSLYFTRSGNIEPMKVDMHNLRQSTIKLLRATEKTCCSIQKTL